MTLWAFQLGKSTIANATKRILHQQGRATVVLGGDHIRSGMNSKLGFSDNERLENIHRIGNLFNTR